MNSGAVLCRLLCISRSYHRLEISLLGRCSPKPRPLSRSSCVSFAARRVPRRLHPRNLRRLRFTDGETSARSRETRRTRAILASFLHPSTPLAGCELPALRNGLVELFSLNAVAVSVSRSRNCQRDDIKIEMGSNDASILWKGALNKG